MYVERVTIDIGVIHQLSYRTGALHRRNESMARPWIATLLLESTLFTRSYIAYLMRYIHHMSFSQLNGYVM